MGTCTTAPLGMVMLSLIFVVFRQVRSVLVWYGQVQCGIKRRYNHAKHRKCI